MQTRFLSFGCLVSTLLITHAQVMIDSFDAGPFTLTGTGAAGGSSSTQTAATTDIAGGTRKVEMGFESNPVLPYSTLSLDVGDGFLTVDRQQNSNILLEYGAFAGVSMNLDATANGEDRFRITLSAAPGSFRLSVLVRDNSSFLAQTVELAGNGPGAYDFPFSAFPAVEFDKLGSVLIGFPANNGPGVYRFESFQTVVPEPEEWTLIAGATLFVAAIARKAFGEAKFSDPRLFYCSKRIKCEIKATSRRDVRSFEQPFSSQFFAPPSDGTSGAK